MKHLITVFAIIISSCQEPMPATTAPELTPPPPQDQVMASTETTDTIAAMSPAEEEALAKEVRDNFNRSMLAAKNDFAAATRDNFLNNGLDVKATVAGKKNNILLLEYVFFSDVMYKQLQRNHQLAAAIPLFDKVVITNGDGYRKTLIFL